MSWLSWLFVLAGLYLVVFLLRAIIQFVSWFIEEYITEPRELRRLKEERAKRIHDEPKPAPALATHIGRQVVVAANLMRSERRSLLLGRLTLGVLIGACFASVRQTQAQSSAVDYFNRGRDWVKKGDYDRAIAECAQAIRLNPNYASAYMERGYAWGKKKEYTQAIADYNQAIRLDPNYPPAYMERGYAWGEKKEYSRAIADCDQAIRLNPNYALAYQNRGCAWNGKKDYDRAIADFNQAIRLNPNDALAYQNRACAWNGKREYDRAIADCDLAIRLNPRCALAYQNRAFAWNGKKDYDRAIADCDQAIRLNPNDALAFQNRGCAWNGKRDYGRAIADFTQAIKLDPNYALAYQNLAWLQATCPDARFRSGYKALENGRRANELDGRRDANDIDTLAAAAAENSYFESARQWEAEAIKLLTNEKDKQDFGSRLKLYEQKKPYRQES